MNLEENFSFLQFDELNISLNAAEKFFGFVNGLVGKDIFRSMIVNSKTLSIAAFVLLSVGGYAAISLKDIRNNTYL